MKILKASLAMSSALIMSAVSLSAFAQTPMLAANAQAKSLPSAPAGFDLLAPQEQRSNTRLDYTVLSEALNGTVIYLGPSHRRVMSRPAPKVGTRIVSGHTAPYRLEGSRVSFSFLSEEYLEELTAYRQDLERIATQIDFTHIPRNEQLAFWFNLHNVTMIEQITKQYPTKYPSRLKVDGAPIDDAKVLTIKGIPLSLRDIREQIVFRNWSNPDVIYGFFRGDIGSPALQNYAYTGDNVDNTLKFQAVEFVNALRGFNLTSKNRNVSRLYDEVKDEYFPNWGTDIQKHLLKYARADVAEDINVERPWDLDPYEDVVADLVGGSLPRIANNVSSIGGTNSSLPDEVIQLLRELDAKTTILRRRKLIGQVTVTIEDIYTVDEDPAPAK